MNKFPYLVFLIIFFTPILLRIGLPSSVSLLFELTSALILVAALIYGALHKSLSLNIKYLILFIFVCAHFFIGAIINSMDLQPVVAGMRNYLKFAPLFLLPLVYSFTHDEIKGQFKFLIALGLLQFPLVLIQRFVLGWEPDLTAGTLGIGSIMSMYLVSCIVILAGYYFRAHMNARTFLVLILLLFLPTTLNETKGSIILLITGLLVVMIGANLKKSQIVMAGSSMALMLGAFILIYNLSSFGPGSAGKGSLIDFFTDIDSGVGHYLYSGDTVEGDVSQALEATSPVIGALPTMNPEEFKARRIDSIILPITVLAEKPIDLLIGLGIGNTSKSPIRGFEGRYSFLAEHKVTGGTLSALIWEIGLVGVILYLMFFFFVYKDARRLSKGDNISSVFALGWTGIVAILIVALPYKNLMHFDAPNALFWYFSGYIAAERFRLDKLTARPSR